MRPRLVLVAAVTLGLVAGQAQATTIMWHSKLMVVTQKGEKTIFKNRTESRTSPNYSA